MTKQIRSETDRKEINFCPNDVPSSVQCNWGMIGFRLSMVEFQKLNFLREEIDIYWR